VKVQSATPGVEQPQTPVQAEGCPTGKQLGRKGHGHPSGHKVEHEPATCPCRKEAEWYPGSIRQIIASRLRERILSVYSAVVRPHLECWVPCWAPQYKRDMDTLDRVQPRATKMKGLEHLS